MTPLPGLLPRLVAVQSESKTAPSVSLVLPLGGVGFWGLVGLPLLRHTLAKWFCRPHLSQMVP